MTNLRRIVIGSSVRMATAGPVRVHAAAYAHHMAEDEGALRAFSILCISTPKSRIPRAS